MSGKGLVRACESLAVPSGRFCGTFSNSPMAFNTLDKPAMTINPFPFNEPSEGPLKGFSCSGSFDCSNGNCPHSAFACNPLSGMCCPRNYLPTCANGFLAPAVCVTKSDCDQYFASTGLLYDCILTDVGESSSVRYESLCCMVEEIDEIYQYSTCPFHSLSPTSLCLID